MSEVNNQDWEGEYQWDVATDNLSRGVWTERNGRETEVYSLRTQHILRIMGFIRSGRCNSEWRQEFGSDWLEVLQEELDRRAKL